MPLTLIKLLVSAVRASPPFHCAASLQGWSDSLPHELSPSSSHSVLPTILLLQHCNGWDEWRERIKLSSIHISSSTILSTITSLGLQVAVASLQVSLQSQGMGITDVVKPVNSSVHETATSGLEVPGTQVNDEAKQHKTHFREKHLPCVRPFPIHCPISAKNQPGKHSFLHFKDEETDIHGRTGIPTQFYMKKFSFRGLEMPRSP